MSDPLLDPLNTKLTALRQPFESHQIGKLPKPTKKQNECDYREKIKCTICEGFHHPKVVHLDYVGHAALTDRLLDVDPLWKWKPISKDENGLPLFDKNGGLWIKLTICGMTRIGYGDVQNANFKSSGDCVKECIGDAIRNAAMRFGAALDLWHKGDLHPLEKAERISEDQSLEIYALLQENDLNIEVFTKWINAEFKAETINDLAAKCFDDVKRKLKQSIQNKINKENHK